VIWITVGKRKDEQMRQLHQRGVELVYELVSAADQLER
jgi:hypothetical protein